jgi:hypothetical protein
VDALFREVHKVAKAYHWSESEILRLERPRRRRYLSLLEEDELSQIVSDDLLPPR